MRHQLVPSTERGKRPQGSPSRMSPPVPWINESPNRATHRLIGMLPQIAVANGICIHADAVVEFAVVVLPLVCVVMPVSTMDEPTAGSPEEASTTQSTNGAVLHAPDAPA
jgi:hypothetical protein